GKRSAALPAGSISTIAGASVNSPTSPSAQASLVRSYSSQPTVTWTIWAPTLAVTRPSAKFRTYGLRSAWSPPGAVGAVALLTNRPTGPRPRRVRPRARLAAQAASRVWHRQVSHPHVRPHHVWPRRPPRSRCLPARSHRLPYPSRVLLPRRTSRRARSARLPAHLMAILDRANRTPSSPPGPSCR